MRSLLAALAALVLPCVAVVPVHAQEQAAGATVTVENMAFGPAKVRVGMGETVTWSFQDAVSHTATSDEGFFDTGAASGGAKRGPMAQLANAMGMGGGMPSPEEMQKMAEKMQQGGGGLPPGMPGLPPNIPGLPGLGNAKLPGLGGFPGLGKKK